MSIPNSGYLYNSDDFIYASTNDFADKFNNFLPNFIAPSELYVYDSSSNCNYSSNQLNYSLTRSVASGIETQTNDLNPLVSSGSKAWSSLACSITGQIIYATVYGEYIYKSVDYGSNWIPFTDIPPSNWLSIACSADGESFSACFNGGKYLNINGTISSTGTSNYVATACNSTFTIYYICFYGNDIYAGVYDGTISGASYSRIVLNSANQNWQDIACSEDGLKVYACNVTGNIYPYVGSTTGTSPNYIYSWELGTIYATFKTLESITCSSSGQYVFACANPGNIYVSSNYGSTFSQYAPSNTWKCVKCSSSGKYVFACVQNGPIYASSNYGVTWMQITTSSITYKGSALSNIICSRDGSKIWIAKLNDTIYSNNINSIDLLNVIKPKSIINGNESTTLTGYQFPLITFNTGKTWTEITTTGYSRYNASAISYTGQFAVVAIWEGGIYYSNDYGSNWAVSTAPNPAYWRGLCMSYDGKCAYGCLSSVNNIWGVYYSYDYGYTWTASTTQPSGVTQTTGQLYSIACSDNGKYVVCTVYGDRIYWSSNYGRDFVPSTAIGGASFSSSTLNMRACMSGNGKYGIAGDLATSGTGGRLYRTINYGVSWSIVTTQPPRKWSISAMSYSGQRAFIGLYNDSN
jgi:photosystem II stability/assembly factor-like uncharacterized protein